MDMYCKFGCMEEAWCVFDGIRFHDVVLWNSMIGGPAMNGHGHRALELFQMMLQISRRLLLLSARVPTQAMWTKGVRFSSPCGTMESSHRGSTMGALLMAWWAHGQG